MAATAGEYRDRSLGVSVKSQEGIEQLSRGGAVDGVAAMRAVDGDDGNRSVAFNQNCIGIGHGFPPVGTVGCVQGLQRSITQRVTA
jgi:hypothetical protein